MKRVETEELVIGKRYYLDASGEVSGVYIGDYSTLYGDDEDNGRGLYFDSIEGNTKKYTTVEGVVGFSYLSAFDAYEY